MEPRVVFEEVSLMCLTVRYPADLLENMTAGCASGFFAGSPVGDEVGRNGSKDIDKVRVVRGSYKTNLPIQEPTYAESAIRDRINKSNSNHLFIVL